MSKRRSGQPHWLVLAVALATCMGLALELLEAQTAISTDGAIESTSGGFKFPDEDDGQLSPALPSGHPFIDVQSDLYWSSSSFVPDPTDAWIVLTSNGVSGILDKVGDSAFVWPVRGDQ